MKKTIISYLTKHLKVPVAVGVIGILAFLVMSSSLGPGFLQMAHRVFDNLSKRITVVTTPAPVIVERLQALNRMETARQVSRQIVEAKSNSTIFPDFLAKDNLQMMVQTEVVAGIDLSRMSTSDVHVVSNSVTITLPQPELFTVRIDDDNSHVYSREQGWLMFHPDKDLERQARLQAQSNAREAASTGEVMATAKTNAETNLRSLLQSLGFDKIEIVWATVTP